MAKAISFDDLETAIAKAEKLKAILASPEVLAFAQILKEAPEPLLLLAGQDRYIMAGEAAQLLGTNKQRIGKFVRDGLLQPWYLPDSHSRRFRLSEVMALPSREVANG